jgi:uncharacterized protein (TIGR03086 family)
MTAAGAPAPQGRPARLLTEALGYALSAAADVTPGLLRSRTPCHAWDLDMLLRHASESLAALREGIAAAAIGLFPARRPGVTVDPAAAFRAGAGWLLKAWGTAGRQRRVVTIAGCSLPVSALEATGALEMAVHGWDISQACGRRRPIPPGLAGDLLALAPLLVPVAGRHPLFAPPLTIPPSAAPSDRLAAFLGRAPAAPVSVPRPPAAMGAWAGRRGTHCRPAGGLPPAAPSPDR